MSTKITFITTGQPATNPRLVKEANALGAAGYTVNVIYCFWSEWAQQKDQDIFNNCNWAAIQVGGDPIQQRRAWWYTRLRQKVSRYFPFSPFFVYRSLARAYDEMVRQALKTKAELYIAHNLGALPVAAKVAQKSGASFAFDAEDFHRGESTQVNELTKQIIQTENLFLPQAQFITTASPLISRAYQALYPELTFTTINNVFSLGYQKALKVIPSSPLKLFWFSQTIGLDRGLQDVLLAMQTLDDVSIKLTLVGQVSKDVSIELNGMLNSKNHCLNFHEPIAEAGLFDLASQHHIGLALERSIPNNRDICLTNKVFTYLLAGNAIIASDTSAQSQFIQQYPAVGVLYPQGNHKILADVLLTYQANPEKLEAQRQAAWTLAQEQLNWEMEQKNWLTLVKEARSA